MGLMQGIELVEDRKTKEPAPKRTSKLLDAAKKRGLLIGKGGLYGNVIRIAPSMLVTAAEVDNYLVPKLIQQIGSKQHNQFRDVRIRRAAVTGRFSGSNAF